MDVHKPKPIHGFREFLGEVGIIVLGVVIALLAEQVASEMHWRHEVDQTYGALGSELGEAKSQAVERVRIHPCSQKRLDQLAAVIDRAAHTGSLEALGDIGTPPTQSWSHAVWDSAVQNGVTAHIARSDRLGLSRIYTTVGDLKSEGDREIELWSRLYALVGSGTAVDAGTVASYRSLISEARFADRFMSLVSAQLLKALSENRTIHIDDGPVEHAFRTPLSHALACKPLSSPPALYGGAPWSDAENEIAESLRYVPRRSR